LTASAERKIIEEKTPMTEGEWTASANLQKMLECVRARKATLARRLLNIVGVLHQQVSKRQISLVACACVRRLPYIDPESSNAIWQCEQHADGLINKEEMAILHRNLSEASGVWRPVRALVRCLFSAEGEVGFLRVIELTNLFMGRIHQQWYSKPLTVARSEESICQAQLLRDIFGNPFCPVTLNPSWLTGTVINLARSTYEDRAFDRMPIMADALEDAGCTDEAILAHCRGPSLHVRGCWVIDLIRPGQ
jgi:hypothetical protein